MFLDFQLADRAECRLEQVFLSSHSIRSRIQTAQHWMADSMSLHSVVQKRSSNGISKKGAGIGSQELEVTERQTVELYSEVLRDQIKVATKKNSRSGKTGSTRDDTKRGMMRTSVRKEGTATLAGKKIRCING